MKTVRQTIAVVAVLALGAGLALASPQLNLLLQYAASTPLTPTDSVLSITLPRFDPSFGELKLVELILSGQVEGVARFESLNSTPRTVTVSLAVDIELLFQEGSAITSVSPSASVTVGVTAYDGVLDFGGTSGRTFDNLNPYADSLVRTYSKPVDLAMFVGTDPLMFDVVSNGTSSGSGPGNIIFGFSTSSSALVQISYYYVPEPASGLILLSVLPLIRRRRRR